MTVLSRVLDGLFRAISAALPVTQYSVYQRLSSVNTERRQGKRQREG